MFGLPKQVSGVVKFIVGLLLVPLVYSFTVSFIDEFNSAGGGLALYFWAGLVCFAIVYIFIYQPELIYKYGQETVKTVFSFYKPLKTPASYLVPIYTVALFFIYGILVFISGVKGVGSYFLLLIGFSVGLHLIFTARALNSGRGDFLKANYIFGFFSVYLLNILLVAFFLGLITREFSFINFFTKSFQESGSILNIIFNRIS